ncbi:MAG: hypothetical protein ACRD6X_06290 [Pyrinomonadaceae bacterium]
MSEVVLTLPDDIAEEAEEYGLFRPLIITSMLKDELRRRKTNRFFSMLDQLNALPDKPTEEEIAEEIAAYRREKRRS